MGRTGGAFRFDWAATFNTLDWSRSTSACGHVRRTVKPRVKYALNGWARFGRHHGYDLEGVSRYLRAIDGGSVWKQ